MSVLFSCGTKNVNAQLQESKEKYTQNNTNYVSVFLDIDFSGKIQIFDKPEGRVIKTLKNNINEGDFIMFDLLEKNDSMFYITAYSSLDNTLITKGWIYKNNHIGIYSSTYNRNFILYKIPYLSLIHISSKCIDLFCKNSRNESRFIQNERFNQIQTNIYR